MELWRNITDMRQIPHIKGSNIITGDFYYAVIEKNERCCHKNKS